MSGNSSEQIQRPHWHSLGLPRALQIPVWVSLLLVLVISFLDLAGWTFNITLFTSIMPEWTPMKIITSICFIFTAIALVIIHVNLPEILRKILPRVLATFICLVSLITIYVYLYSFLTGHESSLTGVSYLGFFLPPVMRMAFLTACNFLLISCIIFLLLANKPNTSNTAHVLIIPVLIVSYFVTVGYVLDVYTTNELDEISVALNSSIAFIGICATVLLMRPDTWLLKVFTSVTIGGIIARKLLPVLMILPVIIGWLRINGERAGLFKSDEGVVLVAITYTISFVVLIWRTSRSVNKIERKRQASEEALHESEYRFRTIAESLPVQIAITRISDSTICFTNEAYDKTFGFKKDELIGKKAHDFYFNPEDRTKVIESLMKQGYVNNIEAKVKKSDGSPFWIISSIRTITFNGEPAYLSALIDITESKKSQDELLQLNRILNSHSKSSKVMMHSDNETNYLNEVCKLIIEDCGYTMVWIGYAQNDKNKTVKPVAFYGFNEGYIEQLNLTWADTEWGRGPTGTAIRTGKPVICKDMLTNPAFKPWRKEALKRGYGSSMVLPLISDGKPFGAISIYSQESNPFSDVEVKLLSDLADDLAYGISYIRLTESGKRSLEIIKESEAKLWSILNATKESVYMFDREGKFTITNATGLKRLKKTSEKELIGHNFSEFMSPELGKQRQAKLDGVFLSGEPLEFEDERGGFIFNHNFYPVFKDKEVSNVVTYSTDITEHKKAEKELQSTKNYLENLINYANAPIIVWKLESEIQLFNHAFEHLTGYSSAEVEGKKLDLLFPKDSLKESIAKIRSSLTENWQTIEIPILTKRKEIRTVLWNSANIYDTDNKTVLSTIAQGNDITERIKAEQEVIKSKEKLEIALECGNIGIWEWDVRTDKFKWDERMGKMFGSGISSLDKTYNDFEEHIHEDDIPHFRKVIQRTLKENFPFELIYRIRRNKEDISYISTKASIEKDNNGIPVKMTGVCFDITQMKKGTEQTLFNLNEDLLRSNKELEQFAYVASHDLQEPLRMISSFTQLLSMRYRDKLDKEAQEFIKFAVDGASRMQNLINDLLEYSRVETRGKELSVTDMHNILGQTINNLSIKIKEKNALVTNDELPTIFADGGQMVQLFQNLIGNAIKFCITSPRIHISAKEEQDHYLFTVKDNGIGIEPQYFDRIFQIFQRLHTKEEYGGTGIGLAICRRIVERHGGKIWVESQPGKGTIFRFTIKKR